MSRGLEAQVRRGAICFYCEARLVAPPRQKEGTAQRFPRRMATREHLVRRCEGGGNEPGNTVLACFECNTRRQDTPWRVWRAIRRPKFVAARIVHIEGEAAT